MYVQYLYDDWRHRFSGLFAGHDPTRGSGHVVFKTSRVGSGQEVFKLSRVGSGRVNRFSNLVGRVRSGPEFFKPHGSGRVESRGDEKLNTGWVRS